MTIAFITARGGSKRLPKKNKLPFCGHPLFAWSLKQACASDYIDGVILTTDDQEIWFTAMNNYYHHKLHCYLRPVWDDDASSDKAFHDAVLHVEKQGLKVDRIIAMFPTSPVRFIEDIDNTIHLIAKYKTDVIGWYAPQRETFIFEHIGDKFYNPVIKNKSWKYAHLASGTWAGNRDAMMDAWEVSFSDKWRDAHLMDNMDNVIGYQVQPWQCIECDYKEWFDINEFIFEKHILKGRGIEIYD